MLGLAREHRADHDLGDRLVVAEPRHLGGGDLRARREHRPVLERHVPRQDPAVEPLSEKLKRIIDQKRNGALQGIALVSALEQLAQEVIELVNEAKKPVEESIAHAAREANPAVSETAAAQIAAAVLAKARELCFPNWHLRTDVKQDLFLAITTTLFQQFKDAGLHAPAIGFVDRCIRLLEKTRFVGDFGKHANS